VLTRTTTYPSTAHCNPAFVACKPRWSAGNAVFKMVLSSVVMKSAVQQIASVVQARRES